MLSRRHRRFRWLFYTHEKRMKIGSGDLVSISNNHAALSSLAIVSYRVYYYPHTHGLQLP